MASHRARAIVRFACSALCAGLGIFTAAASFGFISFIAFYAASIFFWGGFRMHRKGVRLRKEREWWIRARNGEEQDPLDPCCIRFKNTDFVHDEMHCTRYRYRKPKPLTREDRLEIDRQWKDIIAHLRDPEYGEET